jgi:hypothetical protein
LGEAPGWVGRPEKSVTRKLSARCSWHGGGGSVPAAALRTRARRARRGLYSRAQGGGRVPCVSRLRCRGMGSGQRRWAPPVWRRQGWVVGEVTWTRSASGMGRDVGGAPSNAPARAAWIQWASTSVQGP